MATSRLIALIDAYQHAHGARDAELARRIGISRQNLSLWRTAGFKALPERSNLDAVATVIGRPYRDVLDAALYDTGYVKDVEDSHAQNLRIGDRVRTPRGNGVRTLQVVNVGQPKDDWGDLLLEFVDTKTGETIQHPNARSEDTYAVVQHNPTRRTNVARPEEGARPE